MIIDKLLTLSPDDRKAAVTREHPLYTHFADTWEVLANAYDGTGGFMDGGYLFEFPAEDSNKFAKRQQQSRYHNYVETLVELFTRYLTRQVVRETESQELQSWWRDVDGKGTDVGGYVRDIVTTGLAVGHVGTLVDKPEVSGGETKATDSARPFLSVYSPLTIPDWLYDARDGIHAIKLREGITPTEFDPEDAGQEAPYQYLVWDREKWARFDVDGLPFGSGEHKLGRVPFVVFRPKRMKRHPFLGKPLIPAQLVRAIYNRASEEDEVLRDQAFSQLIVSIPSDAPEDTEQKVSDRVGQGGGTQKALIIRGSATYETPDMQTAETLRENQSFLVREIYRMAHVPFRQDTKDVESAEAVRLQHAELNEMLRGMANDLTDLEQNISRLFFAWQSSNEAAAESAYQSAGVTVQYPDEFFTRDLVVELEEWAQAVAFDLGETAEKAIKRRVVSRVLPEVDQETKDAIEAELETGSPSTNPVEQLRESARANLEQFTDEGVS